jgi:hypothetical protein
MSLTAQLLLAWVGLNLPLVALLWYGAEVRQRRRAEADARTPRRAEPAASDTPAGGHTGSHPSRLRAARNPACDTTCEPACECEALRAEVRSLRVTVAELSIDRARLLAKLQPSPWAPPAKHARTGR